MKEQASTMHNNNNNNQPKQVRFVLKNTNI
jgi:hypothetical protein